ncbi:hypothetical protein OV203_21795 [Nannocystis sp. ILAH1]|uniref:hypothetical protein n=1 Tax=Nannocystis sp. ILAH1 TaxID=2996789 RepID=UPI0022711877|nr:hypothetical protein [Nannocystis sp. ILAH1]MCY0989786.1 hypothetical protein [Nannocystis sp. ILAH1]
MQSAFSLTCYVLSVILAVPAVVTAPTTEATAPTAEPSDAGSPGPSFDAGERAAAAAAFWTSSPSTHERIDTAHAVCSSPVRVYEAGRVVAGCAEQARAAGLTLLDLDDEWAPYPLAGAASERGRTPPDYRDTYLQLADERFGDDALAAADRHLELYGVEPSLRVVLAAMDDEARHACHDQVEDESLTSLARTLRMEEPARAAARVRDLERWRVRVDVFLRRHGLGAPEQLAARGEGSAWPMPPG